MKNISVKISESLYTKLTLAAKKCGESRSAIIRMAVDRYVVTDSPIVNESCFDLAEDLSGTANGPADLSSEKKHLHGYGT